MVAHAWTPTAGEVGTGRTPGVYWSTNLVSWPCLGSYWETLLRNKTEVMALEGWHLGLTSSLHTHCVHMQLHQRPKGGEGCQCSSMAWWMRSHPRCNGEGVLVPIYGTITCSHTHIVIGDGIECSSVVRSMRSHPRCNRQEGCWCSSMGWLESLRFLSGAVREPNIPERQKTKPLIKRK